MHTSWVAVAVRVGVRVGDGPVVLVGVGVRVRVGVGDGPVVGVREGVRVGVRVGEGPGVGVRGTNVRCVRDAGFATADFPAHESS